MNSVHHFQRDQIRLRKESYVNGRMSEMIKSGVSITSFEIVKIEVEARKLIYGRKEFGTMISQLKLRFRGNEQICKYLDKQLAPGLYMTPS